MPQIMARYPPRRDSLAIERVNAHSNVRIVDPTLIVLRFDELDHNRQRHDQAAMSDMGIYGLLTGATASGAPVTRSSSLAGSNPPRHFPEQESSRNHAVAADDDRVF